MVTTITLEEKIELILDKVDNDEPLTLEERILYLKEVSGISKEKDIISFNRAMSGELIDKDHIPTDPNIGYEI